MANPLVLLVDTVREDLEAERTTFEASGYLVMVAATAKEALRLLESLKPDLIAIGFSSSERAAWDLIRQLRDDPHSRTLPLFLLIPAGDTAAQEATSAAGGAVLIEKPLDAARIRRALDGILHKTSGRPENVGDRP